MRIHRWLLLVVALGGVGCNETPARDEPAPSTSAAETAPALSLPLHDGTSVSLAELRGNLVLLYFYPKDDTSGCTVEAQGLRDNYEKLTSLGVKVFGVSTDDGESHQAFIAKNNLPFPLVVDEGGKIAAAFDVPVRLGIASRQSVLLDREGKIKKVWREVDPATHAEQVIAAATP